MKNFISGSQKIGKLGEDIAYMFLVKRDFTILERNYTQKWGEIDIIAQKNDTIYFIEVKSKSVSSLAFISSEINRPEDNMHLWKLRRLSKTIQTYLIHKDRKSTRLNSSHIPLSRMPSSA